MSEWKPVEVIKNNAFMVRDLSRMSKKEIDELFDGAERVAFNYTRHETESLAKYPNLPVETNITPKWIEDIRLGKKL